MNWAVLEFRKITKELEDIRHEIAQLHDECEALKKQIEAQTKPKRHAKKD